MKRLAALFLATLAGMGSAQANLCANSLFANPTNEIKIPAEIKEQISTLNKKRSDDHSSREVQLTEAKRKLSEAKKALKITISKIAELESKMKWREKHVFTSLAKLLGGRTDLIDKRISLIEKSYDLDDKIEFLEADVDLARWRNVVHRIFYDVCL